jgi:hypothetical protein
MYYITCCAFTGGDTGGEKKTQGEGEEEEEEA